MSDEPTTEPAESPSRWRRAWLRIQQLKRPLLLVAGTGAVLGGLAGYWNAYQAVKGASAPAASTSSHQAATRSLAVLAFSNLGDDPADDGFAAGVGEELVHVLARVRGLQVIARRSALQFKGQTVSPQDIARQLQAAYLVDGTVRRNGDRVHIGAQLIDGASGAVLWSGQFEDAVGNTMAAQGALALQIARSLKLPLDATTLAGSGTQNVQAWQLFVKAQSLPPGQRGDLYHAALKLDPGFARVHVELAEELLAGDWAGRDAPAVAAAMRPHLEAALRIDPNSAFAYGRLATAAALAGDLDAMRRHARKALELDPGDMPGLNWTAELALREVRVDEALAVRRKMTEIEPLSALARLQLAEMLRLAHQPASALAAAEQALLLEPGYRGAMFEKAKILLALGRRDEALALARPHAWVDIFVLAGSAEDLDAARRRSDLNEHRQAALALADGRLDVFFDHFERDHSDFMDRNRALLDPALDAVRSHPRFIAWLARYDMQASHDKAQAWRPAKAPTR